MRRYLSLLLLSISLFIIKACYPVSYIVVGETKSPINHNKVVVYADFPESFEKIAIMESASDLALKDISILFTDQQKTNKALERLKKQAALFGANGLVIQDMSSINRKQFSFRKYNKDNGESFLNGSQRNKMEKEIKATAIFVIDD
tara:strand:+ start:232 stop:669 length:438 start_codon:yes stop_codon:yes gene_type:complete